MNIDILPTQTGTVGRKGMGVRTILILTAAVLFAGFVTTLYTESPLRDMIDDGAQTVDHSTGGGAIEIERKEQLSDLAMLSYHRAWRNGCAGMNEDDVDDDERGYVKMQIDGDLHAPLGWHEDDGGQTYEGGGYPYLEGTHLTRYPDCFGTEGGILSDWGNIRPGYDTGNDMEGIMSRERFEVTGTRPIRLEASYMNYEETDTWLEATMMGGTQYSYDRIAGICDDDFRPEGGELVIAEDELGTLIVPGWFDALPQSGTVFVPVWIFYFQEPVPSDRIDSDEFVEFTDEDGNIVSPYCNDLEEGEDEPFDDLAFNDVDLWLCEGDEGFVQVNKGGPMNDGEATELDVYPRIELTNVADCDPEIEEPRIEDISLSTSSSSFGSNTIHYDVDIYNPRPGDTDYTVEIIGEDSTVDSTTDSLIQGVDTVSLSSDRTFEAVDPIIVQPTTDLAYCYLDFEVEDEIGWSSSETRDVGPVMPGAGCESEEPEASIDSVEVVRLQTGYELRVRVNNEDSLMADFIVVVADPYADEFQILESEDLTVSSNSIDSVDFDPADISFQNCPGNGFNSCDLDVYLYWGGEDIDRETYSPE